MHADNYVEASEAQHLAGLHLLHQLRMIQQSSLWSCRATSSSEYVGHFSSAIAAPTRDGEFYQSTRDTV